MGNDAEARDLIKKAQQEAAKPGITTSAVHPCLCGTVVDPVKNLKVYYSGYVNYEEVLCDSCRKENEGLARIVCYNCKTLVGFLKPYRDRRTGFEVKGNRHYHISECYRCNPDSNGSKIIEYAAYMRDQGQATKDNLDLLQEIERKRLQFDTEFANLRSKLKSF